MMKVSPASDVATSKRMISGSDCAGEVDVVGEGVTNVKPGDRVVLYPSMSCGQCEYCRGGEQTMCYDYHIFGEHTYGAMAEYAVAPAANLFHLPEHVTFVDAAAMPVAYTTAWRMIGTTGEIQAGDSVLILGVGGAVGSTALVMAKRAGARVFATARTEEKRRAGAGAGRNGRSQSQQRARFPGWIMEQNGGPGVEYLGQPLGATGRKRIQSLGPQGPPRGPGGSTAGKKA